MKIMFQDTQFAQQGSPKLTSTVTGLIFRLGILMLRLRFVFLKVVTSLKLTLQMNAPN